ncbi:transglutaminase domain-containing protein [Streptomyces sp. A7024]|uniref:Transglutaminase domain-containing protein n=1 Tax=Streptomyces coryli TaxID=1128680 RepID=A0A6G4TZI3_9ACTN|nr:transglutaminase-like domain-containing protein [Streptomyces coryli]NGN64437.1 transglutaminase domain-containing protein [Streptomyces coryli]
MDVTQRAFYIRQSGASEPGPFDDSGLPHEPTALARLVRGLVIHREEAAGRYGVELAAGRKAEEAETRYVDEMMVLDRGRSGGLPVAKAPRSPVERFAGTCRDFALLHCALLRHTGTPARIRCGFAAYLVPGTYEDHWVTEWWDDARGWVLTDPQVVPDPDAAWQWELGFDPFDVPRDRFVVAGEAWRRCRTGRADPAAYGVGVVRLSGLDFVKASVVRDLAALNGVEVLPWDGWGLAEAELELLGPADYDVLDAAAAAGAEGDFPAARRLYAAHEGLRAPRRITSHTTYAGERQITLRP